jgi:ribosomal protein L11
LEKEDEEMEGFDIKITSDEKKTYEITVTTPGSKTSRLLKMSMKHDKGNVENGNRLFIKYVHTKTCIIHQNIYFHSWQF